MTGRHDIEGDHGPATIGHPNDVMEMGHAGQETIRTVVEGDDSSS
jgi:hypothetical protein